MKRSWISTVLIIGLGSALLSGGCALPETLILRDATEEDAADETPEATQQPDRASEQPARQSPASPTLSPTDVPTPPEIEPTETAPPIETIVEASTGNGQIGVPEGWIATTELHNSAELQVYHPTRHLYVIALADPKRVQDPTNFSDIAVEYLQQFLRGPNELATVSQPTEVTRIAGYPAVQYEIQGQFQGTPITYLHTTVNAPDAYYQILGWSLTDRFDSYEAELQRVIQSFEPL